MLTSGPLGQLFSYFALREDPFHVSPNQRFYFSTGMHDSALVEILWGLESRQGLVVLTGQAGTGKTTVINRILRWLEMNQRSSAYVFHTCLEPTELIELVLRDFGVPCSSSRKVDLVAALHRWVLARNAAGDSPVLIVDEAQVLSIGTLDEFRLLLNLENDNGKLLQIVLAGQLELEEKLQHPELQQLRQRVMIHSRLSPFTLEETTRYISLRLTVAGGTDPGLFPLDTVEAVYACSRGIPRLINLLCKDALVSAYVTQEHTISPQKIYAIASELGAFTNAAAPAARDGSAPFGPAPAGADSGNFRAQLAAQLADLVDRRPVFLSYAPTEIGNFPDSADASHADRMQGAVATTPSLSPAPLQATIRRAEEQTAGNTLRAPIVRYWADASDYFGRYLGGICGSFIRDCRRFVEVLSPQPNLSISAAIERNPPARKRFLGRVACLLRRPMTPLDVRGATHPRARPASPRQL